MGSTCAWIWKRHPPHRLLHRMGGDVRTAVSQSIDPQRQQNQGRGAGERRHTRAPMRQHDKVGFRICVVIHPLHSVDRVKKIELGTRSQRSTPVSSTSYRSPAAKYSAPILKNDRDKKVLNALPNAWPNTCKAAQSQFTGTFPSVRPSASMDDTGTIAATKPLSNVVPMLRQGPFSRSGEACGSSSKYRSHAGS